jgi:hypothetical protein
MPSAPKFAIGVEPKQAIEFLRQKKMLASKVLAKEMHDSALARATTIARLTSLDMTKDIYQSCNLSRCSGLRTCSSFSISSSTTKSGRYAPWRKPRNFLPEPATCTF